MINFLSVLERVRFQILALALGSMFVFLSFFQIEDVKKLKIMPATSPVYPIFAVGVVLLVTAVVAVAAPRLDIRGTVSLRAAEVTSHDDAVSAAIGKNKLTVRAGRLEQSATDTGNTLVVLPANEYFDDECINDRNSALGAFVQARFPGRAAEFEAAVTAALPDAASRPVSLPGGRLLRYELGTAAYLDQPLNQTAHLLVAATTTQRPGEGLRGDAVALFKIARQANLVAKDNRLSSVHLPLIGAGHGSIKPTRALLYQLLAWCEILYAHPNGRLSVEVILFQPDENSHPEVPLKDARDLLRVAMSVCAT
ncbi:macro domain-containing protein [Streptomyces naphthomycinicus]|uniref:macro domain-containing protein n=1 Tax=Streptomyces naphthomycinicus TaxID=2872625 RepID=UPI001CEC42CD|nr:macro domain-containing protein [Streptomyces sp. TML10]